MKKILLLSTTLLIGLSLTACGSEDNSSSSKENKDKTVKIKKAPKYSFSNDEAKLQDVDIKINKTKVIQKGEKGNEYGKNPIIAFWYSATNKSDKEMTANDAWIAVFNAYQSDKNSDHKLEVGQSPDDKYLDSQMDNIKKNGTVKNAIAYDLHDSKNPVKLVATKGYDGDKLGTQTYKLSK